MHYRPPPPHFHNQYARRWKNSTSRTLDSRHPVQQPPLLHYFYADEGRTQ